MNYTIAILITTFLRDNLLYKTIQSIVQNHTNNCIVLIADQGYSSYEKENEISYCKSQIPLEYYRLPFDCGLSYARNFLIKKASDMNIPYILLSSDSIQFTQLYDFESIIKFLNQDSQRGLCGFKLQKSKIDICNSKDFIADNNIQYIECNITNNIFLAKTKTLLDLYDNEMKLYVDELAFLEYKKRGYKIFYTDYIQFKKINTNNSKEYKIYNSRLKDYQQLFEVKLGISNKPTRRKKKNVYRTKSIN